MKTTNAKRAILSAGVVTAIMLASSASATTLSVSITNEQPADGVFLTPLASVFHDGSFDLFDAGDNLTQRQADAAGTFDAQAAAAVEGLAEGGAAGLIVDAATAAGAQAGVVFGTSAFGSVDGQPPLIDPSETATALIDVNYGTDDDVFFSFFSMILPTNDAFIGNDNATAYQVVTDGVFQSSTISVYTNDAWDAGTEANNFVGLPFSPNGGTGATDTPDGIVAQFGDLAFIDGAVRGAGFGAVGPDGLSAGTLLATIQIAAVPVPAGLPLLAGGLGLLGLAKRRRKA